MFQSKFIQFSFLNRNFFEICNVRKSLISQFVLNPQNPSFCFLFFQFKKYIFYFLSQTVVFLNCVISRESSVVGYYIFISTSRCLNPTVKLNYETKQFFGPLLYFLNVIDDWRLLKQIWYCVNVRKCTNEATSIIQNWISSTPKIKLFFDGFFSPSNNKITILKW